VGTSAGGNRGRVGTTAMAVVVAVLTGCAGGTPSTAPPTVDGQGLRAAELPQAGGSDSGCPEQISRIVDTETPATAETVLALDFSGSFVSSDQARARIRTQTLGLVEQSVERGQALRILTFTRTASGAGTIIACPSLTPRFNNAAARRRKVENLKRQATAAVDVALQSAIRTRLTQKPGRGTSIVGGFLAIDQSASLVGPGTPRDAVMFSDGEGLDEDVPVDLSDFRMVSLYGVGAKAEAPLDTPAAAAAAADWQQWLLKHGAKHPNTSTQAMF
jgi:hypothetical protein